QASRKQPSSYSATEMMPDTIREPPKCQSLKFFFQAEDGIRDRNVTGVQTCALPISLPPALASPAALVYRSQGCLGSFLAADRLQALELGLAPGLESAAARVRIRRAWSVLVWARPVSVLPS